MKSLLLLLLSQPPIAQLGCSHTTFSDACDHHSHTHATAQIDPVAHATTTLFLLLKIASLDSATSKMVPPVVPTSPAALDPEFSDDQDDDPESDSESDSESAAAAEDQPTIPTMLPPPNGRRFENKDALEAFVHFYTNVQGYSIATLRSAKKGKSGEKIYFQCTRGGHPSDNSSTPDTQTARIGCPVVFYADCLKRTNYEWEIDSLGVLPHNHGPAITPYSLAPLRQIDREGREYVKSIALSTRQTCRSIWLSLKAKHQRYAFVRQEDVKNLLSAIRQEDYGDYTSTQYFVLLMAETCSYYDYEVDETGRLKYAYWTFLKDLGVLAENSEVVIVDNTYKASLIWQLVLLQ